MAIENLEANKGIYKALSKLTGKDYYKTKTGVIIKTDKGKGSVTYNKDTGEITCEGLENAIITGTLKADKITIVDCKNIKAAGGLGNDEFTIKYSDTIEINGGLGKDQVTLYDNPKNVKLKSVEKEIPVETPTTPPTEPPKEPVRDGIIDGAKQGTIDDSHFLTQLNEMSYTEAGAQIIKESITWDDENRQAIVHCKGLGIDMTVSYDELEEARKNGCQTNDGRFSGSYSEGDDDVFLLEYVMTKLYKIQENSQIDFDVINISSPLIFLAGTYHSAFGSSRSFNGEDPTRERLKLIENDKKNLYTEAKIKSRVECELKDANGKSVTYMPGQIYAIKEVKNGYVTVINPKDSTNNSPYTQIFTYDDFCNFFNIDEPTDFSKIPNNVNTITIEGDVNLSDYGITVTTAKILSSKRDGEIEWSSQRGIGDCWCLSQINAMSYTEEGRKIIKEAIVWDDENQRAIVHCKGLGVDMVVSYDELKEAEEKGNDYYELHDYHGSLYSEGDDDVFLLEYVMTKLYYLEENGLIDFELCGLNPGPFQFLASFETPNFPETKEFLGKLEADGGKNLAATAASRFYEGESEWITDVNGKEVLVEGNHSYAIKEVKDGYVTVVNPWDSSDDSEYTMVLTYDDFCKYFWIENYVDFSKNPDEKTKLRVRAGINPSDYGITNISGEMYTYKRDGIIEWSENGAYEMSPINDMASCDKGAQIIKDSILWDDEKKCATVHCNGLGIDITVSYDELEYARKNIKQVFNYDCYGGIFLAQDDDAFLLQYVSKKIENIKNDGLITFDCIGNNRPENYVTFLAGTEANYIINDEVEIKEFLDKLEADGGRNLVAKVSFNIDGKGNFTDVDTRIVHEYRIKEVKNGYITLVDPVNTTDILTLTYEDFCKYLDSAQLIDYSEPSDKTPEIVIDKSVNLEDYGITITSGILKNKEDENDPIPPKPPTPDPSEPVPVTDDNPIIIFDPTEEDMLPDFNPRFFSIKDSMLSKDISKYRTFEE